MTDTKRSLTEILTNLPVNLHRAITGQAIRDLAVSVFPPQYIGARISDPSGADQGVSAGSFNVVTFDTENFDTHGFADLGSSATRLTIPSGMDGLYLIGGTVKLLASTGNFSVGQLRKNGAGFGTWSAQDITTTVATGHSVSILDLATAGTYYELQVYPESAAQDITHDAEAPYLWLVYLGQAPA